MSLQFRDTSSTLAKGSPSPPHLVFLLFSYSLLCPNCNCPPLSTPTRDHSLRGCFWMTFSCSHPGKTGVPNAGSGVTLGGSSLAESGVPRL